MFGSYPIVCVVLVTVVLGVGIVGCYVARCALAILCVRVNSSVFRSVGVLCFVSWVAVSCPLACVVIVFVVSEVVFLVSL